MHRDVGFVHRHVREVALAGDVADRPDAVGDAAPLVDGQVACGVVDTDRRNVQFLDGRAPSDGDEQLFPTHYRPVTQRQRDIAAVHRDLLGRRVGAHVDALALEDLGQQRARFRFLRAEDALAGFDDRHRDAEAGKHLAELQTDRSAAEDRQRRGKLFRFDGVVVGPVAHIG